MAKTLDAAGVKRLIQEIKGANKNLNAPIPISTDNTPESKAQNVKNIADYVEKVKAAGVDTTKSFRLTLEIDGYPVEGSYDIQYSYACGLQITDDGYALLYNIDVTTGEVFTPCEIVTARSIQKVTSSMLDKGARKPIILTPSTTEVDEETYQKLLSDDVDVVFKTSTESANICTLTYKYDNGNYLGLYFTCFSVEASGSDGSYLYAYEVKITKTSPHTCSIIENYNTDFPEFLEILGYLNKSTLTPVLQEIDLIGTDADRKAKLDQFETDWMALTGASDLRGARFVGRFNINDYNSVGLFNYNQDLNYEGISCSDTLGDNIYKVVVNPDDGSLTITPLFSHLEAITIYTDNTPAHMQANLDNIAAYETNLQALGVTNVDGIMIPIKFEDDPENIATTFPFSGYITKYSNFYDGIVSTLNGAYNPRVITINGQQGEDGGKVAFETIALDKQLDNYTPKSLNAKSLEAITIKTGNTPDDKAANVAAINAYVDNLTALGVDTTKGYMIPVKLDNNHHGFIMGTGADRGHTGVIKRNTYNYGGGWIFIDKIGTYQYLKCLTLENYNDLTTTAKAIIPAINEVNALAKSKQDTLTSGTNIKTVNGKSLLGSGDIAISGGGDVTAAGDNTFTGNNVFSGIAIADILDGTQYQITGDNGFLMFTSGATNEDIQLSGVATPTYSNSAANKQYVDDKVAAAGGGSAPVLVDIDDISGSAGDSVPVDVFNKIANAASAKTPIFGYSKLVNGPRTTYEIIPLYVKNVSTTAGTNGSSIQFIAENAYNSIVIMKRSDTECSILISSSHPFALDTSVDKSSTRGIQSSAVWKEIHSEPMTVNTATSGVTTLSSTDKHKILCYADSGTQQYNLPPSPVDGETFLFLKVKSGHTITIQSDTGNQNIYDCSSGNSVVSKTIASSTKRKITVTYSSTVGKWFLMADDFLS